jgi:hypothetical protein
MRLKRAVAGRRLTATPINPFRNDVSPGSATQRWGGGNEFSFRLHGKLNCASANTRAVRRARRTEIEGFRNAARLKIRSNEAPKSYASYLLTYLLTYCEVVARFVRISPTPWRKSLLRTAQLTTRLPSVSPPILSFAKFRRSAFIDDFD